MLCCIVIHLIVSFQCSSSLAFSRMPSSSPITSHTSVADSIETGWSAVAIETAKRMTENTRKRLKDEGVLEMIFPVRILGQPVRKEAAESDTPPNGSAAITKVIHFQRHGQGFHNTITEMWRELGKPVDLDSHNPDENPLKRLELLDAPLTEVGRRQCLAWQAHAARLQPEILIVSPLLRTLQTAELSWRDHTSLPWVAHEGCREDLGVLICNQRQERAHIASQYPKVDFSLLVSDEDSLFLPHRHETGLEKSQRIYDFLLYLRDLPQHEIAVVTHSAWLFHMCNAVMEIADDDLSSWFLTSEIRSLQVTFSPRNGFH